MSNRKNNIISKQDFAYLHNKGIPYEGYVEDLGYVLPEVTVVGYSRNPHYTVFSIHRELTYTVELIPGEIRPDGLQQTAINVRPQYEVSKEKAKTSFKKLLEKKVQDLQASNLRDDLLRNNPHYEKAKKMYTSLIWSLDNKAKIYKTDVPREILNEKATKDYFAYFNTEDYNKNQKYLNQHPDYGIPEPVLRERRQQQEYRRRLENWQSADPLAAQAALGMRTGLRAAPLAIAAVELGGVSALVTGARSMFAINTKMWGLKLGMSVSAQTAVNSRKIGENGQRRGWLNGLQEVNWIAAGGDAFFNVPLTGSMVGGAFEIRPLSQDNKFILTGYNKSVKNTAIDIGGAFFFGKIGSHSWNALNPLMRNTGEHYFIYISTQTWNYVGAYGASNRLNEQYGRE